MEDHVKDMEQHVKALIVKAADTAKSEDALRFSQAACNVANTLCALGAAKKG